MADQGMAGNVVDDDGATRPASEIPRIVLEASELPGGAPAIFAEGLHSQTHNNNIIKLSLFQNFPGVPPVVDGDKASIRPNRRIVAYLTMDVARFADMVLKMNTMMKGLADEGVSAIGPEDDG